MHYNHTEEGQVKPYNLSHERYIIEISLSWEYCIDMASYLPTAEVLLLSPTSISTSRSTYHVQQDLDADPASQLEARSS